MIPLFLISIYGNPFVISDLIITIAHCHNVIINGIMTPPNCHNRTPVKIAFNSPWGGIMSFSCFFRSLS